MSATFHEAVSPASEFLTPLLKRVRRDVCWVARPGKAPLMTKERLTRQKIEKHLNGGPYFGAAFILPGTSTTRVGLLDLDSHKGEVPWGEMVALAGKLCRTLEGHGCHPMVFRSSGGLGIHIYLLWEHDQDAYSVRQFLAAVLADHGYRNGTKGVAKFEIEIFPKQDSVPADGYGSMAILPLARHSRLLEPLLGYEPVDATPEHAWAFSRPVPFVAKPERPEPVEGLVEPTTSLSDFVSALRHIPNDEDADLDYDTWRNVIFSIHHATGGSDEGLNLAHEWSSRSPKYDREFLDNRVWPYIRDDRENGITDQYVMALARAEGWGIATPEEFEDLPPIVDEFAALAARTDSGLCDFDNVTSLNPAPEAKPPVLDNRFPVLDTKAFMQRQPTSYFIKGVLPKAELIVMYGASTAGKSFMALDLAAAVDRGVDWRGLRTKKARVVYICAEGAGGFRNRVKAYQRQHACKLSMGIIEVAPNFLLKEDVIEVAKAIKAWGGADLIVVDTWAQVLPGANENSGEDIGKALGHCKGLNRALSATVMLVHHSGKDETKGARGWSGLKAAADAELEITRDGECRAMTITKMKDGADGRVFGFALQVIPVDLDEDGDEVTSCYVVEAPYDTSLRRKGKSRKSDALANKCMAVLSDNLLEVGGGMDIDVLINEVVDTMDPPPEGKRDTRRQHVRRALAHLEKEGSIVVKGVFVFPGHADD